MPNMLSVAGPNSKYSETRPAGFLAGFWHGLILPITFLVSIFAPGVRIYEVHNKGVWYDLGFIFGVSGSVGGTGSTA